MSIILPGTQVAGVAQEATVQSIRSDTQTLAAKDFATQATSEDILESATATNSLTQFIADSITGSSGVVEYLAAIDSDTSNIATGMTAINSKMSAGLLTSAYDTIELISSTGVYDVYQTSLASAVQQTLTITYSDESKVTATKWAVS